MASYFLKENYTQISNDLLEALCRTRINGEARQLFDFILRKTYGFHKEKDAISTSQIAQGTGLCRRSIERGRRTLKQLNMITTNKIDGTYYLIYGIQADPSKWKLPTKLSVPINADISTDRKIPKVPTEVLYTKDNKENIQKINGSPALQAVFERVFNEGLNVYQLLGRLKKESKIPEDVPESVLIGVCEQYFRDKGAISNDWGWFVHVFQLESAKYYAQKNVQDGEQFKKTAPVPLGDILKQCLIK